MIWEIDPATQEMILERALGRAAVEKARAGLLPTEILRVAAQSLKQLSITFTAERISIGKRYLDQADVRAAYLLYFLPANIPKIWFVLDELSRHPSHILNRETLRVLDLGSGVGTASLATLLLVSERLPEVRRLEITAVDNSSHALADCRWLIEQAVERMKSQARS